MAAWASALLVAVVATHEAAASLKTTPSVSAPPATLAPATAAPATATSPSPAAASPAPASPQSATPAVTSPGTGWTFPQGETETALPARFFNGTIVVRMTLAGGRGLDLALDTGAGVDFLDASVVASLGGAPAQGSTLTLAQAGFGAATAHDLRFTSGSFARRYDADSEVLGLLGYDFLKNVVLKIDYESQSVALIDPQTFALPASSLVLALDPLDRVPVVPATIGTASGTSFIIDSGASMVVVFPRFTQANAGAFAPNQQLKDNADAVYYRMFRPLCGEIREDPYAVSQVALGTLGVRDWTVWKPDEKSCFSPAGVDGLIGYDFLRLFDVYVDYPHLRVVLVPNELYRDASNTIKP